MGFSAKGQQALFEIAQADDWGLDASAFDLPPAGALPANVEAQALGRDQARSRHPEICPLCARRTVHPVEDQRAVRPDPTLARPEDGPRRDRGGGRAGSLSSIAPSQARAVRSACARRCSKRAARARRRGKPTGNDKDIKRLIINMERWRWMPEDLGSIYVWNNSPEFRLYVVKDGKAIFARQDIGRHDRLRHAGVQRAHDHHRVQPGLGSARDGGERKHLAAVAAQGNYSILKIHKLSCQLINGKPVDVSTKVDWNRVNSSELHLLAEGGPPQQSRQGEIPLSQPAYGLPARHAAGAEEILQAVGAHDRA